ILREDAVDHVGRAFVSRVVSADRLPDAVRGWLADVRIRAVTRLVDLEPGGRVVRARRRAAETVARLQIRGAVVVEGGDQVVDGRRVRVPEVVVEIEIDRQPVHPPGAGRIEEELLPV